MAGEMLVVRIKAGLLRVGRKQTGIWLARRTWRRRIGAEDTPAYSTSSGDTCRCRCPACACDPRLDAQRIEAVNKRVSLDVGDQVVDVRIHIIDARGVEAGFEVLIEIGRITRIALKAVDQNSLSAGILQLGDGED